ncbi:plastocyanin/azurin family copper-binding protein [Halolamina rubra]|uniref:plastocyanin/azurin family copper-binding protein n=1 Tax=Halolamina rubra TaxID=1380430 RepID=UPI000679AD6E|nr:plastocyanin/azurin family copper-binding protein [Halolamina rubra]
MDNDDALSRRSFLRAGTVGAATAAAAGTAAAQEGTETATPTGTSNGTATGTATGNETATGTSTGGGGGGGGGTTHTVDMTDDLIFDPDSITVAVGDTIVWENVGSVGHSVTAYEEDIPDGAEFWASGGFDNEQAARDNYPDQGDVPGGESYEHTFETVGTHEYFCIPHEGVGMVGTVEVVEELEPTEAAGGGGPAVPDSAKTLGVGAAFAMVATLLIAFFFLKYGGDSPGHDAE